MPWGAVAGAAIGAIGSNQAAKSANKGSTTSSAPWSGVAPYLTDWQSGLYGNAQNAVLPATRTFAPHVGTGAQMQLNQAMRGPSFFGNALDSLSQTIRGDYLDPGTNPQWNVLSNRLADAYSKGTAAQTDAAFNRAGAFGLGNSAYQETVQDNQRSFGDALSNLEAQIFGQERQRQMLGIGMAPSAFQGSLMPGQAITQGAINPLQQWSQILQGFGGGTTTQSGGYTADPISGAVGGALLGNQLYQNFNQPDYYSGNAAPF